MFGRSRDWPHCPASPGTVPTIDYLHLKKRGTASRTSVRRVLPLCLIFSNRLWRTDAVKYQKIHLPSYDTLILLCDSEQDRSRGRARHAVTSLGSITDSSSMLSLPGGSGQGEHPLISGSTASNGYGQIVDEPQVMHMGTKQNQALLKWESGEDDGHIDLEASYMMPNAVRPSLLLHCSSSRLYQSPNSFTIPHSQHRN